jgi:iron complex outermembrane receptor protein
MLRNIIILICMTLSFSLLSQVDIEGVVGNEDGENIAFASVFLLGSNYAAISDEQGRYLIEDVVEGEYILKATFLGFQSFEKKIIVTNKKLVLDIQLSGTMYQLDQVEILSNRVTDKDAYTYTQVDSKELDKNNNGQDLPFALRLTPSVVVTSDAGAGIGYTGIRIRGTDASRVNVTINGVPLNDSESQGVFWVNLPDILSSTESIQIQRGVGTSTSGTGAFGGSVSLNTSKTYLNPYASVTAGLGSYNTSRLSIKLGTGLINDHYSVDARYSLINSDGYIDRASSDLNSLYFSASRVDENSSLRLLVFSGHEVTYQSWYGAPESRVFDDREGLVNHYNTNIGGLYFNAQDSVNLFSSDRRYNYYQYENQVDDYRQTHVQLHGYRKLSENFLLNTSVFYTKGRGFFEEFKVDQNLQDYDIEDQGSSDLVRRRWLDNDYMGAMVNASINISEETKLNTGIHFSKYLGDHFGNVVNVLSGIDFDPANRYYINEGNKSEASFYVKGNHQLTSQLSMMGDLQYRKIDYTVEGDDNDGRQLSTAAEFSFFNPKVGLFYQWSDQVQMYGSYAIAHKEPNRSDFIDRVVGELPMREKLANLELGVRLEKDIWNAEAAFYHMGYDNQLVLTGALNDVGSPLRTNVKASHRMGIELSAGGTITGTLSASGFATFSTNKINAFEEILYDYTTGFEEVRIAHEDTDIAFSPSRIVGGTISFQINDWISSSYLVKHVGEQFLDNTSNNNRKLNGYTVHDLRLEFQPELSLMNKIKASLEIRNIWNALYASNGYTYSYIFGDTITENYLYPQAERNVMINLGLSF